MHARPAVAGAEEAAAARRQVRLRTRGERARSRRRRAARGEDRVLLRVARRRRARSSRASDLHRGVPLSPARRRASRAPFARGPTPCARDIRSPTARRRCRRARRSRRVPQARLEQRRTASSAAFPLPMAALLRTSSSSLSDRSARRRVRLHEEPRLAHRVLRRPRRQVGAFKSARCTSARSMLFAASSVVERRDARSVVPLVDARERRCDAVSCSSLDSAPARSSPRRPRESADHRAVLPVTDVRRPHVVARPAMTAPSPTSEDRRSPIIAAPMLSAFIFPNGTAPRSSPGSESEHASIPPDSRSSRAAGFAHRRRRRAHRPPRAHRRCSRSMAIAKSSALASVPEVGRARQTSGDAARLQPRWRSAHRCARAR